MLFVTKQKDVRQGALDRVARPSSSFVVCNVKFAGMFCLPKITEMGWVNREIASERPTQRFVGPDEDPQPLIDLTIFAFSTLLNGLHQDQSDPDADERDQAQAEECREHRCP